MAPWKYRLIAGAKLIGLLVFFRVFFPLLVHPTWSLVVLWSFGIVCTIVGFVGFSRHVYPALKDTLNAPLMRLLLLGVSWFAGLLAYIQARRWIMLLTEVDPNNFPRALVAFAGLLFVPFWLVI